MGHEVKFRFWHKEDQKWITGEALSIDGHARVWVFHPDAFEPEVDPVGALVFYTGLNDKNGKEIYEGDILRGAHYNGSFRDGVVKRGRGAWMLDPFGKTREVWAEQLDMQVGHCDIIGNIYEHPELIKT